MCINKIIYTERFTVNLNFISFKLWLGPAALKGIRGPNFLIQDT